LKGTSDVDYNLSLGFGSNRVIHVWYCWMVGLVFWPIKL